jgi:putative aldouronate transport system substrate-binding protein
MDGAAAQEAFIQGKVGMIAGPHWMVYWPFGGMTDAEFRAIPLPAGPDGHVARRGSLPRNGAILISNGMEKPEYFFKYQNFLFDTYALREGELKYGLAENYDWSYAGGRPSTDPRLVPGGYVRVANYTLTFDGARIPSRWRTEGQPNTVEVLLSQQEASWIDQYRGAPTPTQREKGDLLRKLEEETFGQIIYGRLPLEAFDDFVDRWLDLGGRQITEEVNAWRDSRRP